MPDYLATYPDDRSKTFQSSRCVPDDVYRSLVNDLAKLKAAGRSLVFLTYFEFNQAFVCRDMDTRLFIALHNHKDYGPFPDHGSAFDYCETIKPIYQTSPPSISVSEEVVPWWVD